MRSKTVGVNNIRRLNEAGTALRERHPKLPGIGVIYGRAGDGKTTALAWWVQQHDGAYVRALATWTPRGMLESLCDTLGLERAYSNDRTVRRLVDHLSRLQRPVVIDEADYIVDSKRLMETLRDLHDLSGAPVILVGMAQFAQRLASRYQQFSGRVAEWVEFKPATIGDCRLLADELAEVDIADDLVARIHTETGGSIRRICIAISQVERHARIKGKAGIDAAGWGDKPLTFDAQAARLRGDAPRIAA